MQLDKAAIIRRGTELGVDYAQTLSCYDPAPPNIACGTCDSCQLRAKGFAEQCMAEYNLDGWTASDLVSADDVGVFVK